MTKHEVNYNFTFDDSQILNALEYKAYNDIVESIKKDFVKAMPQLESWKCYNAKSEEDEIDWKRLAENQIAEILNTHQDEIIQQAAKELAKSFSRSKAFKEAMINKLTELMED